MSDLLQDGAFTGFKPSSPVVTDFLALGETAIIDTVRNLSGDWRSALPTDQTQLMKVNGISYGDTEACTDFSATNVCKIQLDWMIAHGQVPHDALNFLQSNGYIDANGHVSFSPRFTAKMSGTTPQSGNTLQAVWASIRHDGLVPDSAWPAPTAEWAALVAEGKTATADPFWAKYYEPVPADVIAIGQKFLKWFQAQYEWIAYPANEATMAQLAQYLQVSPLQICTAVCSGWNTDNPIHACGAGNAHATTLVNVEPGVAYDIYDHYNPFSKRFSSDYNITYAMRGVLSYVSQTVPKITPFTYDYQTNLGVGAPAGPEVKALQQGLQTAKNSGGVAYMKGGLFGPYGPQTEIALAAFQADQGINNDPMGANFGPKSRTALTAVLLANAQSASGEPLPSPLGEGSVV